ncbi:hypothetical protein Taro_005023 [Colocasia esculenta]|uniref:BRCT domain-containing protein n=1 Tax=Colocasia esculenta TaxID=4460 RepID=A0A843TJX1_COLES|nr:hypothetical protein [Colocasia esculenta]
MEAEATSNKDADGNSREPQLTKRSMTEQKCWQNSGLSSSMVMFSNQKTTVQAVEALTTMPSSEVPSTKLEDDHVDNASVHICMESNKATVSNISGNCNIPVKFVTQDGKGSNDTLMKEASLCKSPVTSSSLVCPNKEVNKLSLSTFSGGSTNSDAVEVKSNSLIYSRKTPRRSVSTEDLSRKVGVFSRSLLEKDIPSLTVKQDANEIESVGIQSSTTNTDVPLMERLYNELPQKRKIPNCSSVSPKLQPSNLGVSVLQNSFAKSMSAQFEFPLVNDACQGGSGHQLNDVKNLSDVMVPTSSEPKEGMKLSPAIVSGSFMISDTMEVKSNSIIYSRKTTRRSTSAEVSRKIGVFPRSSPAQGIPCLRSKHDINDIASAGVQSPTTNTVLHHIEGPCSELPQTRNVYNFSMPQNSQSGDSDMFVSQNSLASSVSAQLDIPLAKVACQGESTSPLDDAKSVPDVTGASYLPINQKRISLISSLAASKKSVKNESHSRSNVTTCLKGQLMHSFHGGGEHEDSNSPECKIPVAPSKTPELSFQLDNEDVPVIGQWNIQTGGTGQARNLRSAVSPSCSGKDSERGKLLSPADPSSCKESSGRLTKRVVAKKKLSCRSELSAGYSCRDRSSVYSNEVSSPNESTLRTEQEKGAEGQQKDNEENSNMVGIVSKSIIMNELPREHNYALISERIVVDKDSVVSLTEKNVVIESAFKPKEIEMPILKKTAVTKTVREKVKKFRHRQNNHCTKNATKAAIQVWNDTEKENKPAGNVGIIRKTDGLEGQSLAIKCDGRSGLSNRRIGDMTNRKLQNHLPEEVISQSAWFIFSGHQVQRKEFQKVVRRLRGRLCRDSHSWSYQATHFIVPSPIRRTEKFFAATASGRWILKTDYLTACNEAGKFLVEEPFEWYGDGLTEDGTISLQAPRKWRLLRERTGHGAFYGVHIIIYGECIAPSLDTLKRVIKSGDGMILATSPPYTRFLKSEVDFAVLGPSVQHTDTWIQEFLRHEIPCVSPDYLVEFVCKHGFPLDKHILYGTHAWAEKSIAKLQSRSKEIVVAEH